jgi:hypothetical protein
MAFTGAERVRIRMYMGASATHLSHDSRLESAIATAEADADLEVHIRTVILVRLAAIDARLEAYETSFEAHEIDELTVDAARASAAARTLGRMWVNRLAAALGMGGPRTDCYAPAKPVGWGMAPGLP